MKEIIESSKAPTFMIIFPILVLKCDVDEIEKGRA
jgi:hypothetical protein